MMAWFRAKTQLTIVRAVGLRITGVRLGVSASKSVRGRIALNLAALLDGRWMAIEQTGVRDPILTSPLLFCFDLFCCLIISDVCK